MSSSLRMILRVRGTSVSTADRKAAFQDHVHTEVGWRSNTILSQADQSSFSGTEDAQLRDAPSNETHKFCAALSLQTRSKWNLTTIHHQLRKSHCVTALVSSVPPEFSCIPVGMSIRKESRHVCCQVFQTHGPISRSSFAPQILVFFSGAVFSKKGGRRHHLELAGCSHG